MSHPGKPKPKGKSGKPAHPGGNPGSINGKIMLSGRPPKKKR